MRASQGVGAWLFTLLASLFLATLFAEALFNQALSPPDLAAWAFPFVGTLLGAFLAFKYLGMAEAVKREELRAGAINRAILVLVSQINYLSTVKTELFKDNGTSEQMSNLRALPNPPSSHIRQRVEELVFLVELGESGLVMELEREQRRYDDCLLHLNIRNDLLFDVIHPMVARAGIMGKPITMEQFRSVLGEMNYGRWEVATRNVCEAVPSSLESIPTLIEKLCDTGKKLFPRRKFIGTTDLPRE
ncbi:hypothetical protein [Dyella koreensis]|uniref:DUF4760 domain-containing protein n=1 Tax=Dyella koreensis TaxID=311235 RepID=A0ABW8JZ01_9GAMM